MNEPCNSEQEKHCQHQLDVLFEKIDRLDESIRGNGKPGIIVRLDRLEQSAKSQGKLIWLLIGSAVASLATVLTTWLTR